MSFLWRLSWISACLVETGSGLVLGPSLREAEGADDAEEAAKEAEGAAEVATAVTVDGCDGAAGEMES